MHSACCVFTRDPEQQDAGLQNPTARPERIAPIHQNEVQLCNDLLADVRDALAQSDFSSAWLADTVFAHYRVLRTAPDG
jgi:hypothetical protein